MTGRPVLLVVLALALLGGARDAVPAGAQEEVITAVGTVSGVPFGTVNSSRVELTFPAGGGPVTGEWNVSFTVTVETCTITATAEGPLEGTYDGIGALNGTTTVTTFATALDGCKGPGIPTETDILAWSASFDGERVSGTITDTPGSVVTFTAQKPPTERPPADDVPDAADDVPDASDDVPDASDDIDEPPDDASDSVEPPDDSLDIAGVFFGTEDLKVIMSRADSLIQCTSKEDVEGDGSSLPVCNGYADGLVGASEFYKALNDEFPSQTEEDEVLGNRVARAIYLAGLTGKDGSPLFPSVFAALPVIARIADEGTQFTGSGQDRLTVVERFIELLAGRDAAAWEKRFP